MSDSAMLIKEYRVVLPLTVDEYQAAQLWSVAEASKNETGGGEGIEIHKNEPYALGDERGQFTHKTYHLESRVSGFVRMIARKGMLQLEEEAWNAYPYCKTVLKNAYMKDAFEISIETIHLPDAGTTENAHKLAPETWKKVEVVNIDIAANDQVSAGDYKAELDPTRVRSARAGRGPLGPEWIAALRKAHGGSPGKSANGDAMPVMCCYKLVRVKFKWFGLQNRIEALIHRQEKRLFTNFHRQLFCWMDNWFGMTMDEIRELEAKTKKELQEMINQGELRGTRVNTDEA